MRDAIRAGYFTLSLGSECRLKRRFMNGAFVIPVLVKRHFKRRLLKLCYHANKGRYISLLEH
jgi:hypothetical protein